MSWPTFHLIVAICASTTVLRCASLHALFGGEPEPPEMTLVEVTITNWSLNEIDVELLLNVKNRDDVAFNVQKFSYAIDLNQKVRLGTGSVQKNIQLPPHGQINISLPLKVDAMGLLKLVQETLAGGQKPQLNIWYQADVGSLFGNLRVEKTVNRSIEQFLKQQPGH